MKLNDIPKLMPVPFGVSGPRTELLPSSPAGDRKASYKDGFPPITMLLKSAGGLPPDGGNMNQILFELASGQRWSNAGARYKFNETFSDAVGGYPKGAQLLSNDGTKVYVSTKDDNKTDFNASPGSDWVTLGNYIGLADYATNIDLNKKFDKAGGTISGTTIISRSWEALKVSATASGAAHFIRLADIGGNTASLGFLSDNSNNLSLNNEKTSTMFHVADGEIRVNSKRCLTTDDLSAAVPVGGSVIWNSSSPIPANFWKHDGRSFSAAEYPEAAKALPDLKVPKDGGYFLRITDDGAGVDPGRQVGTYQNDAGRRLEGKFSLRGTNGTGGRTAFFGSGVFNPIGVGDGSVQGYAYNTFKDESPEAAGGQRIIFDSDNIYQSVSEFRPKNVSKFLIVRMK